MINGRRTCLGTRILQDDFHRTEIQWYCQDITAVFIPPLQFNNGKVVYCPQAKTDQAVALINLKAW